MHCAAQRAVLGSPGQGGHSLGDLALHEHGDAFIRQSAFKQAHKNGGGYVIGDVGHYLKAWAELLTV